MAKISSYRLGDLILLDLSENDKNLLNSEHPGSFGAQYLARNTNESKIEKISKIVMQKIDANRHLFPADIEESTVIHLRLGDVVAGNQSHEKLKRPLTLEYYTQHITNNEKIYIIGIPFFAHTSSQNYDECIQKSTEYLEEIKAHFNAIHIDNNSADMDLCCAVLCKKFVKGRGFFSELILQIRKHLHKHNNIETDTLF